MRVLALAFPGMTLIDLVAPLQALSAVPGTQVQVAWKSRGPVPTDAGVSVIATHAFGETWRDPDVLFVPGNTVALCKLLHDDETVRFVAEIGQHAGWITSVCNGSLLLGAAGLLKGFRAGCYWYTRDQLALFGAIPDPSRVVFDRNRATGGGMTAGVDFGLALVGKLVGEDTGRLFELLFEYAPDPPFKVGRPELAPPPLLGAARDMLSTLMPRGDVEAAASKWKHA
jgi:cyclohexyl-isocyanide hydratase